MGVCGALAGLAPPGAQCLQVHICRGHCHSGTQSHGHSAQAFADPASVVPQELTWSLGLRAACRVRGVGFSASTWDADASLTSASSPAWTTIVGLLYHSVHYYLSSIQPASTE